MEKYSHIMLKLLLSNHTSDRTNITIIFTTSSLQQFLSAIVLSSQPKRRPKLHNPTN
jgi:hypothetical protein